VHPARRSVPSTLAETASIFAENIIRDAALAAAADRQSRLAMLDARLAAGVSFLMNIPFRFHLERELYTMRRRGDLDPAELCERTVAWQRDCYRDHLESWYPHFWAEKLHFYMSGRSFYNYPYTFGYLFSSLVYQRARAEGPGYHPRYIALLERTGWQDAEPLAADMLGLDLTSADDWYQGIAPLEADLAAFEQAVDA
jgi:oligoendopeptidase F